MGRYDRPQDVLLTPAERRARKRERKAAAKSPDAAYAAIVQICDRLRERGDSFASPAVANASLDQMLAHEDYSPAARIKAVERAEREGIIPLFWQG